jgi:hypothetical protein
MFLWLRRAGFTFLCMFASSVLLFAIEDPECTTEYVLSAFLVELSILGAVYYRQKLIAVCSRSAASRYGFFTASASHAVMVWLTVMADQLFQPLLLEMKRALCYPILQCISKPGTLDQITVHPLMLLVKRRTSHLGKIDVGTRSFAMHTLVRSLAITL